MLKDKRIVSTIIIILSLAIIQMLISYPRVVISLIRSECFGTCPAYEVTIHGDGSVFWKGENFVEFEGEAKSKIEVQQVRELIKAIEDAGFFSMNNYEYESVTDHPWAVVSITLNGESKTVSHYYGNKNAPIELYELECKIDEIANTNQWIGWDEAFCRDWIERISK